MNVLEKILEEIEERENEWGMDTANDFERDVCYGIGIAKEIIEEELERLKENDGWIPVEERLPDNDEENVLVVVNGKYKTAEFEDAIMLGNYSRIDKDWCIEGWGEWDCPNVTAWIPLPEPYKPKEKVTMSKNSQQELEDFWMDR